MKIKRTFFLGLFLLCFIVGFGQDSIKSVMLERIDVIASSLEEKQRQTSGDAIKNEQIDKSGFRSVGDAVRFLSGVTVKDYGGVGGLKTVSVRGLGAMHTNVSYDGISITNSPIEIFNRQHRNTFSEQRKPNFKIANSKKSCLCQHSEYRKHKTFLQRFDTN